MKHKIVITVRWKEQGHDFRRADLLLKHLAANMPKVLFRADIDQELTGGCKDVAASNPEGFDDYILFLRYDIRLVDADEEKKKD